MKKYTKGMMAIHWLVAAVVIPLLSLSFFLEDLPKTIKPTAIMLHKSFGITILALMLLRLFWLKKTGRPALPKTMTRWELGLARIVQWAMYTFLIIMPLTGWFMSVMSDHTPVWFGLIRLPIPGIAKNSAWADILFQGHQIIAWILIALVSLHIAGALKHAIIDKDKVLDSMLP
ncbi:MAG: cytochrome b [Gammaproteobacteria bacterium]